MPDDPAAPSRRDRYHHGDLPTELVRVSVELVEAQGVDGFRLREAARRAGVDVAAVYRHFRGRSDLLGAVADAQLARLETLLEGALEGADSAGEGLAALCRAYVRYAVDHPTLFRLAYGPFGAAGRARASMAAGEELRSGPGRLVLRVLEELWPGSGTPPASARLVVWASMYGLACLFADGVLPAERLDDHVEAVTGAVLRGLASDR